MKLDDMTPEELAAKRGDILEPHDAEVEEEVEEVEAEAEAEVEEEPEETEEERRARIQNHKIPKYRLDEVTRKAREREAQLTQRIQELESQTVTQTQQESVRELQEKRAELSSARDDALLDGDREKAKTLGRELDQVNDQLIDVRASTLSNHSSMEAIQTLKYEQALSRIEQEYPQLNPDLPEVFDEEAIKEVAELAKGLQAQGQPKDAALRRAVKYVCGEASSDPQITQAQKTAKATEDRKQAVKNQKKAPPDLTRRGKPGDAHGKQSGHPTLRTPEDFAKLSEEERSKLRGDALA